MQRAFFFLALGLVSLAALAQSPPHPQSLRGADTALRKAARRQSADPKGSGTGLSARLTAYGWGKGLSPEVAAAIWPRLYDDTKPRVKRFD